MINQRSRRIHRCLFGGLVICIVPYEAVFSSRARRVSALRFETYPYLSGNQPVLNLDLKLKR